MNLVMSTMTDYFLRAASTDINQAALRKEKELLEATNKNLTAKLDALQHQNVIEMSIS